MVTVEDSFVSPPRARAGQAMNYAASMNPRPKGPGNWRQLAELYWYYAPQFNIDPLLPWAQMMHETGSRSYGGDVDPYANNYAGIGATSGIERRPLSHAAVRRPRPPRPSRHLYLPRPDE